MKKQANQNAKNTKPLIQYINTFGKLSIKERDKAMQSWISSKEIHESQDVIYGPFNPTAMDYLTYINYLYYLRVSLIDAKIGSQQDFIPTQNYELEYKREFRRRDGSKWDDENLWQTIHFLDTIQGENISIEYPIDKNKLAKKYRRTRKSSITKIW